LPNLMLSALQVNIAGGRLPPPEDDGRSYLKIPLNAFPQASRRGCGSQSIGAVTAPRHAARGGRRGRGFF
jgi:hypothetical protein